MSYILDALRRAAQERGHAPAEGRAADLLGPPSDTPVEPATDRAAGWWWGAVLGFAAGVLALGLATWWADPSTPAPAPVTPGPTAVAPVPPEAPTASQARPLTQAPAPLTAGAETPPPTVQLPPPVRSGEAPVPRSVRADATPPTDQLPPLPDGVRGLMPPLQVGGAMHSDVPSQRMLVLNGRVLREGDEIAGGVVLERIELKAAVLRHDGQRYRLSY